MSLALHGRGVSKGVAIGQVYIIVQGQQEVVEYTLAAEQLEDEVIRFEVAMELARQQLRRIRDQIPLLYRSNKPGMVNEISSFIDPHLMMLDDSMLTKVPTELIRKHHCNAEWALKMQRDRLVKVFEAMEDPYLQSRKVDVDQVISRIQYNLIHQEALVKDTLDAISPLTGKIILADDLAPADTILMQYQGIAAFATEHGGPTSHTAILARSLGIPAVVGVRHLLTYVRSDDQVIVDGDNGVLLMMPDAISLRHYQAQQEAYKHKRSTLVRLKNLPVQTLDGQPIGLYANIELPDDMAAVRRAGADGIGLFRTEFLFMNRNEPPDEEEHLRIYTSVLHAMEGRQVTIRTLDLGADKQVDGRTISNSDNAALGLRAIRLCLKDSSLFRPQLRAILRASALGPLQMLIPMLSSLHELKQVRNIINELQVELDQQGLPYNPAMPIGGMVEVPAMVTCIDLFLPHVQFVSIGTNDLIQYALAIDRCDNEVNYLYDPQHPAVLRMLRHTLQEAARFGVPASMCGEMAGDSRYVKLLLGLGLRAFSVNAESYLEIKEIIISTRLQGLRELALQTLNGGETEEIEALMERIRQH